MFDSSAKREAIEELEAAVERHETVREDVGRASVRLFERRMYAADVVMEPVEDYLNRLANSPKEFDRTVAEFRIEVDRFADTARRIETEAARSDNETDEAEEGAISSVFAWLGNRATDTAENYMRNKIAALLVRAGPVGWAISGAGLVGAGIYINSRNKKVAEEAIWQRLQVEELIDQLQTVCSEIEELEARTRAHVSGCFSELDWLRSYDPKKHRRFRWLRSMVEKLAQHDPYDYRKFDREQKERLAALINHVRSLSELISKEVVLRPSWERLTSGDWYARWFEMTLTIRESANDGCIWNVRDWDDTVIIG